MFHIPSLSVCLSPWCWNTENQSLHLSLSMVLKHLNLTASLNLRPCLNLCLLTLWNVTGHRTGQFKVQPSTVQISRSVLAPPSLLRTLWTLHQWWWICVVRTFIVFTLQLLLAMFPSMYLYAHFEVTHWKRLMEILKKEKTSSIPQKGFVQSLEVIVCLSWKRVNAENGRWASLVE